MQFTLTGRRLALAAVLVLAGALAPLAYSALDNSVNDATRPFTSPLGADSVATSQAPAAVADNPYQFVQIDQTTASGGACRSLNLPAGQFALKSATVVTLEPFAAFVADAELVPVIVNAPGTDADGAQLDIPVANGGGTRAVELVVKPAPVGQGAVGDVRDLRYCLGNTIGSTGATVRWAFIVTGQKITATLTAATVRDFNARPHAQGAMLRWTTGSESNLLGFNVWRFRNGKGVKVNRTLIRAKRAGEPKGASYSFPDTRPGATRGLSYRLQLVDVQGKRTWYAAFAIPA
jgi:hypothetical protein